MVQLSKSSSAAAEPPMRRVVTVQLKADSNDVKQMNAVNGVVHLPLAVGSTTLDLSKEMSKLTVCDKLQLRNSSLPTMGNHKIIATCRPLAKSFKPVARNRSEDDEDQSDKESDDSSEAETDSTEELLERGPVGQNNSGQYRCHPYFTSQPTSPSNSSESSQDSSPGSSPRRDTSIPQTILNRSRSDSGSICFVNPVAVSAGGASGSSSPTKGLDVPFKPFMHLAGGGLVPSTEPVATPQAPQSASSSPIPSPSRYTAVVPNLRLVVSPSLNAVATSPSVSRNVTSSPAPSSASSYASPPPSFIVTPVPDAVATTTTPFSAVSFTGYRETPQGSPESAYSPASVSSTEDSWTNSPAESGVKSSEEAFLAPFLAHSLEPSASLATVVPSVSDNEGDAIWALSLDVLIKKYLGEDGYDPESFLSISPERSPRQVSKKPMLPPQMKRYRHILPKTEAAGFVNPQTQAFGQLQVHPQRSPVLPVPIPYVHLQAAAAVPLTGEQHLLTLLDERKKQNVELRVAKGEINVLEQDHQGDSNLHISVANGDLEAAYVIAKKMMQLAQSGNITVGRQALVSSQGGSLPSAVDIANVKGQTPLYNAVAVRNSVLLKFLLECGASPNKQCKDGTSPLHYVAMKGQDFHDVGNILCQSQSINLNQRNSKGFTPLHCAVIHENIEESLPVVRMLLRYGADLTFEDSCSFKTALQIAVERGSFEMVTMICNMDIKIRDNINHRSHSGTALHSAALLNNIPEDKQLEIVQELLKHGADRNIKNARDRKIPKDLVDKKRTKVRDLLSLKR